ncbi:MAG: NDP-sugar synthase [Myxococcales bacterium]|nr:NDP-sugar synthase [Myxococcales bacterium]
MKALVLCAGYGRRLGDLTRDRPKPLLEVGEHAIVEHILARLAAAGFDDVWINLHHHAAQFPARLGDGSAWGLRIHWLLETEPMGTAGTVSSARTQVGDAPLLVHYGDILTDHDLAGLMAAHRDTDAWATILVHDRPGSNSVAVFGEGDRVETFLERPSIPVIGAQQWAFSGICVLSPSAQAGIPRGGRPDLPAHVFPVLAERGLLFAQRLAGFRCAIDSPERLDLARRALASGAFVPTPRRRP